MSVRILSGYLSLPYTNGDTLRLVYSTFGVSTSIHRDVAIDGQFTSRSLFGDPRAGMPDRVGAQLRYVPSSLASPQLALGVVAGGTAGADLKWGKPGPGVGSAQAGIVASGNLGFLGWSTQISGGWGMTRRLGKGSTPELPVRAGAAAHVQLGFLDTEVESELGVARDLKQPGGAWSSLALLGLSVPVLQTARVHLAASVLRDEGGTLRFGGMLAISGQLGLGDLDGDGIPDDIDACPGVKGDADHVGCPFESRDHDAVGDRLDACPDVAGPENNAGCPLQDTDGDGIPDIDDPCPTAKECPES